MIEPENCQFDARRNGGGAGKLLVGLILAFALSVTSLFAQNAGTAVSSAYQFAITSISVQGTNLIFTAVVPNGIGQVNLQTSSAPDAPWAQTASFSIQPGMTEVVLTIPKPAVAACFFRLEASSPLQNVPLISNDLQYVAMPSLGTTLTKTGDAAFHFKGLVDGSDKIIITHDGVLWNHINWQWPIGPIKINGVEWNPEEKNYLTTVGASKFLPDKFSLESVDLEVTSGRDVVAMERATNALIVYLDDTPCGASEYEFTLHFHPVVPKPVQTTSAVVAHLKITAQIDGSDLLKITAKEATWEHKFWDFPAGVALNSVHWDPAQTNVLINEGTNTFLPSGVDLSSARIVSRKGRDLATMWAGKDALWVWFADNPNGSDFYELDITFGQ